jgi:hypothetical protein
MSAIACPFCGVVTDVPHETQEGCIEALQTEIVRVREILDTSRPIDRPAPPPDGPPDGEPGR